MRVHDAVRTTLGHMEFIAPRENKAMRRDGAVGVVSGVLGKREQIVLVMHEGASTPAVYLSEELQLEPNVYWKFTYSHQGLCYFVELATYDDVQDMLDELDRDGINGAVVEGPFFSNKELTHGLLPARSLFDRLKD